MDVNERECPYCGSKNTKLVPNKQTFTGETYINECKNCGRQFS